MNKLTNAQIYTLRRMKSGIAYCALGDGSKGFELRAYRFHRDYVKSLSVPCLLRFGLIEFDVPSREPTKLYGLRLTVEGVKAAETLKINGEKR
ncbi:hypothetical protein [Dickeya dadantii]|uniref:hypothetical protein n=1 Tax=Dickeya dadantii TaxID=204038 RepID=UPI0020A65E90|nr:hypothetical protein [Dickeya dadantii]